MVELTDKIVTSPAEFEYSFNFSGNIYGDYSSGQQNHMYLLLATHLNPDEILKEPKMPQNQLFDYQFTVKIGQRLEDSVRNVLQENFGLEELFSFEYKISTTKSNLVYVRAVCKSSPLSNRKFDNLNLYWYGI